MSDSGQEDRDSRQENWNPPSKKARTSRWVMPNSNDLTEAERNFLRSHDRKLSRTWLENERSLASAWLNPKPWKGLRSELNTAERVVNYSDAQKQMLRSLNIALLYEAETPQKQQVVDWIEGELKQMNRSVRMLKADIKRLTRLTYCHNGTYLTHGILTEKEYSTMEEVPHWLISGMNLLIADFSRAAVVIGGLIERHIQNLQSSCAPVFQAYHAYWKLSESYLEVARDSFPGTRGQQAELACTKLQTVIDHVVRTLELIQDYSEAGKFMGQYFARCLHEYQLLLERAEENKKPMTLDRFVRYGA